MNSVDFHISDFNLHRNDSPDYVNILWSFSYSSEADLKTVHIFQDL